MLFKPKPSYSRYREEVWKLMKIKYVTELDQFVVLDEAGFGLGFKSITDAVNYMLRKMEN